MAAITGLLSSASGPKIRKWASSKSKYSHFSDALQEPLPVFFTGEEALVEVARDKGKWDWACVRPEPEALSLLGGGLQGLAELQDAMRDHHHYFGLVRLSFDAAEGTIIKHVLVHGSGAPEELAQRMEARIHDIVAVAAVISVASPQDCTPEAMVRALHRSTEVGHMDGISIEGYLEASQRLLDEIPGLAQRVRVSKKMLLIVQLPSLKDAKPAPEPDLQNAGTGSSSTLLRRPVKPFKPGEQVEVFVPRLNRWMLDGEVALVAPGTMLADGVKVRAGSTKVLYANGQRYQWVAPQDIGKVLRASRLPKVPAPLEVELRGSVQGWFWQRWSPGYAALNKGFLQWWGSTSDAKNGEEPSLSIYLLGLQRNLDRRTTIELRSDGTHGVFHRFMASSVDVAARVLDALDAHAKYCEASRQVEASLDGNKSVRHELMQISVLQDIRTRLPPKSGSALPRDRSDLLNELTRDL